MKYLIPLILFLFSLPLQAGDHLPYFTGFKETRSATPSARVLVLLFSQPECGYCDLVRRDFLLPLQQQQRHELVIRELKLPGSDNLRDRHHNLVSAADFAGSYSIGFYPSVLMLSMDGTPLDAPLVGISSTDFYGYYLDQAITLALTRLNP